MFKDSERLSFPSFFSYNSFRKLYLAVCVGQEFFKEYCLHVESPITYFIDRSFLIPSFRHRCRGIPVCSHRPCARTIRDAIIRFTLASQVTFQPASITVIRTLTAVTGDRYYLLCVPKLRWSTKFSPNSPEKPIVKCFNSILDREEFI